MKKKASFLICKSEVLKPNLQLFLNNKLLAKDIAELVERILARWRLCDRYNFKLIFKLLNFDIRVHIVYAVLFWR